MTNFRIDGNALWRAAQTPTMAAEIQNVTGAIGKDAGANAPRTRGNAYRNSIKTYIQRDPSEGIRGLVVASRHEMVIEFGWTDLRGRWHPGRFILTNALKRQRTGGPSPRGAVEPKPSNRALTRGSTGRGRTTGRPDR